MDASTDRTAIVDEQRRADRLRRTVDVTCALLRQGGFSREEGEAIVAFTRRQALALFPGKEDVWQIVLAPRFRRILDESCRPDATSGTARLPTA